MCETEVKYFLSDKLEDYAPFHDAALHKKIAEKYPNPKYTDMIRQLTLLWDGASLVRSMGWYAVTNTQTAANAAAYFNEPLSLRTLTILREMLLRNSLIGGVKFQPLEQQALHSALIEAEKMARDKLTEKEELLSAEFAWKQFSEDKTFKYSLWHSEIQAFCQLYFAYENFLVQISILTLSLPADSRKKYVGTKIVEAYGQKVLDRIWNHEFIDFARLIRNAVTHSGARAGKDLVKYKKWMKTDGFGTISIATNQTIALYKLLSESVDFYLDVIEKHGHGSS